MSDKAPVFDNNVLDAISAIQDYMWVDDACDIIQDVNNMIVENFDSLYGYTPGRLLEMMSMLTQIKKLLRRIVLPSLPGPDDKNPGIDDDDE